MLLERLRAQLIGSLGEGYILAVEEQLKGHHGAEPEGHTLAPPDKLDMKPGEDKGTQFSMVDSNLAHELSKNGEEGSSDDDSVSVAGSELGGRRLKKRHSVSGEGLKRGRSSKLGAKGAALKMLSIRQIGWTISNLFEDKMKRDAVDELEQRLKLPLSRFVPDFFVNRHGLPDVAQKHLANFVDGANAAAMGGNRRAYLFCLLCGYMTMEGDYTNALAEAGSQQFYLELERKAMVAAGEGGAQSEGSHVWLPLDRAIELMRNEFRYARVVELSKWTGEVEDMLRLPDEIFEINQARDSTSGFVNPLEQLGSGDQGGPDGFDSPGQPGVPVGLDVVLFKRKSSEEQAKLMRRREDALVQNKVLRALTRRGFSLRELFAMLDVDGNGEIDPEEFIQGIQQLEGQLTDAQCARLMEITDTDNSGTVDFNELTRALQKLDLRVELHDYLIIAMRFYSAEMQRTAQILRKKFTEKAGEGKPKPISDMGAAGQNGKEDSAVAPRPAHMIKLNADAVRALIKSLDTTFQNTVIHKIVGEMVRYNADGPATFKRQSSISTVEKVSNTEEITCEAFVRVLMAHGFHAVGTPAFKESALTSGAGVMMAVNTFAKKLPGLGRKASVHAA